MRVQGVLLVLFAFLCVALYFFGRTISHLDLMNVLKLITGLGESLSGKIRYLFFFYAETKSHLECIASYDY